MSDLKNNPQYNFEQLDEIILVTEEIEQQLC